MARLLAATFAASALIVLLPTVLAMSQPGTIGFSFEKTKVAGQPAPSLHRRQSGTVLAALSNGYILYLNNVTFPAQSAAECLKQDRCPLGTYNQQASTSYRDPNLPQFQVKYTDDTKIQGPYISDVLRLGSITLTNMTMVSATNLNGRGIGIMGLGFSNGESAALYQGFTYPNIIDVLVNEGHINARACSLWLSNLTSTTGSILFGGVDSSKYQEPLIGLPIQLDSQTHNITTATVAWTGLTIHGSGNFANLSPTTPRPAILDSGATATILTETIFNVIFNGVGVTSDPNLHDIIPCKAAHNNLTFTFTFGGPSGASINAPLSEFIIPLLTTDGSALTSPNGDLACSSAIEAAGSRPINFGDSSLRSAYVVYDLDNQVIGLAQTNFNAESGNGNVRAFQKGSSGIPGVTTAVTAASVAE